MGWLVLTGGLAESLGRASLDVPEAAKSTESFARLATHGIMSCYPRSVRQVDVNVSSSGTARQKTEARRFE